MSVVADVVVDVDVVADVVADVVVLAVVPVLAIVDKIAVFNESLLPVEYLLTYIFISVVLNAIDSPGTNFSLILLAIVSQKSTTFLTTSISSYSYYLTKSSVFYSLEDIKPFETFLSYWRVEVYFNKSLAASNIPLETSLFSFTSILSAIFDKVSHILIAYSLSNFLTVLVWFALAIAVD